jgi:Ulp1 family protease
MLFSVLDLFCRVLTESFNDEQKERIHILSSFFITVLRIRTHEDLRRWLAKANIDLSSKPFLLIPVNITK